jgi:arylsulfatase
MAQNKRKPNILIIWGDDVGIWDIGAYHRYDGRLDPEHRPHRQGRHVVRRSLRPGLLHGGPRGLHHGPYPIRVGLGTVGLPGEARGLQKEDPTLAELLKPLGYATGQFGKNHLCVYQKLRHGCTDDEARR